MNLPHESYRAPDYGGYSGGGGGSSSGFRDSAPNQRGFDEYDAGNDEVPPPRRSNTASSISSPTTTRSSAAAPAPATTTKSAASKAKEVDLLGFMDDDFGSPAPAAAMSSEKALPAVTAPATNPLDGTFSASFAFKLSVYLMSCRRSQKLTANQCSFLV